jgi:hypothetical protein
MDVLVIHIDWFKEIPIGKVYDPVSGGIRYISLLHSSFVIRYNIGIGSVLQLSSGGTVLRRVVKSYGEVVVPKTADIFDRWYSFRTELLPYISPRFAMILFVSGIETVRALHDKRGVLENIRGIGPVTLKHILTMFDSP